VPAGTTGTAVDAAVPDPPGRLSSTLWTSLSLVVLLAGSILIGQLVESGTRPLVHDRMLPWILTRGLGLASYAALTALVLTGIWLRHPWRTRFPSPHPEALLRVHVTLAAAMVTLLAGHLTATALDHYAGVGWVGIFVPWASTYRPTAVTLGTISLYLVVLVVGTAALAGSLGRRIWLPIHSLAVLVFCSTLAHALLAGSDAHRLRWFYAATGAVVALAQVSRWLAGEDAADRVPVNR
jgi:sulfoxide reductase heme-binding subunit YedZ